MLKIENLMTKRRPILVKCQLDGAERGVALLLVDGVDPNSAHPAMMPSHPRESLTHEMRQDPFLGPVLFNSSTNDWDEGVRVCLVRSLEDPNLGRFSKDCRREKPDSR